MRFLIDECLSPDLVIDAGEAGYEAHHVARVGKAGWQDWNVVRYACDGNLVLVTNNAADFRRLYAAEPLQAGLVIILPNDVRMVQRRVFLAVLDLLDEIGEPVNQVVEVGLDEDEVTMSVYTLAQER